MLPFSLAGRPFLRERLFPDYARHAQLPGLAAAWEPLLEARLGPAIDVSERGALFEVPGF
jgi:hypothetical protein